MTSYFRAYGALENPGFMSMLVIAITVTAGTTFLMWLGELITEKGIGNGISLIIFAGIVSRLPSGLMSIWSYLKGGQTNVFTLVIFAILALIIIAGVVTIQEGERKIPVQYAKRVIGRKMYGGQSSHIPVSYTHLDVYKRQCVGDKVLIAETRPLSKDKRWRLQQILEKAPIV